MPTETLLIVFFIVSLMQCGYAIFFFGRIFQLPFQNKKTILWKFPASIIICAKNEAGNLAQFLPLVLKQDYRNREGEYLYEVIVVNDESEDETSDILKQLQAQYTHLKIVGIHKNELRKFKGKKQALSKGVAAASNIHLVFTDADCAPSNEHWLQNMMQPFFEEKEIVVGYGAYRFQKGFLNAFIQYETLHGFLQYATYTLAGKPFMAVGRNLACNKNMFLKAQQGELWNLLPSGDDDLLMRIVATKNNTAVTASCHTVSVAKQNWKDWFAQKQRHNSTGKHYKLLIKILLAGYAFSHALIWVLFITLLLTKFIKLVCLLMLLRCLLVWLPLVFLALKMKQKKLIAWIPLLDFSWLIYNLALSPFIFFKNKQTWK